MQTNVEYRNLWAKFCVWTHWSEKESVNLDWKFSQTKCKFLFFFGFPLFNWTRSGFRNGVTMHQNLFSLIFYAVASLRESNRNATNADDGTCTNYAIYLSDTIHWPQTFASVFTSIVPYVPPTTSRSIYHVSHPIELHFNVSQTDGQEFINEMLNKIFYNKISK